MAYPPDYIDTRVEVRRAVLHRHPSQSRITADRPEETEEGLTSEAFIEVNFGGVTNYQLPSNHVLVGKSSNDKVDLSLQLRDKGNQSGEYQNSNGGGEVVSVSIRPNHVT